MADGDVISVSSGEEQQDHGLQRRAILEPAIINVVNALGGYEGGVYRLGDEAYGCLKDLKKFWRKDDTDDERTVARILWASRVLPNDLVPIILETAGKGHVEDKRAIACTDLITAMTWPIDLAEELKELDEEFDRGSDYTQLVQSHLHYKAALLGPGVLQALFSIVLPCLARGPKTRTERDVQIVNVILHLIRNLAFIKDLPANVHLSADQAEFSSLQSRLIRALAESRFFDLLLTIASGATTDSTFNGWNALVLETFYLLFRGVKPSQLVLEQSAQTKQNLRQLLTIEDRRRRDFARNAPSRHSRFGTTISVRLNPKKSSGASGVPAEGDAGTPIAPDAPTSSSSTSSQPFVLHRQQALSKESGAVIDLVKRQNKQKGKKEDEVARNDNLTPEARTALRRLAHTFIESCFNPFLASLLKDIKSERPKITEKDNLRLLFVTKWFLEYFLAVRTQEKSAGVSEPWAFGLVGEVIERGWIVWVLKRMNGAVEEKPKLWTELQAGIECLTQLLALLEAMASTKTETDEAAELHEAAVLLQQQLVYNGQVLDAALDGLRVYKDGTQSLTFLRSSVHLTYALMRMLEKWAKTTGDGSYVRKRAKPKKKRKAKVHSTEEEPGGVPDAEEEELAEGEPEDDVIEETMFTFESFELKFANADITHSLLTYIGRHKEFTSSEEMKRVVSLLHRQAVRAKAEGLFFQVSTLNLFKTILAEQKSFPKEQPYKDLVALINYVLRQFFKAVEADSFVLIEAFFPKNRNRWKRYSSWEPENKNNKTKKAKDADTGHPPDVQVKKGFSWSEQLAIAMAALQDAGQSELIEWVKEILAFVIAQRQRIEERAKSNPAPARGASHDGDEDIAGQDTIETEPSSSSADRASEIKIATVDYIIPYTTDARAEAAARNSQLRLMFRLAHFHLLQEDDDNGGLDLDVADEPQWYIPAGIDLPDLQRSLTVIEQFELSPLDLGGKRAAQLLQKKRRRRARRRRRGSPGEDDDGDDDEDDAGRKHKVARKAREREKYTSAQFIEDSDEEYGRDIEEFFAREAALRERTALAAVDSLSHIGTMRATGTKKRRRKRDASLGTSTTVAKRSRRTGLSASGMQDVDGQAGQGGDHGGFNAEALRPSRPEAAAPASSNDDGDSDDGDDDDAGGDDGSGGGSDIDHDSSDRSSRSFLAHAHRDVAAVKHRHSDPAPPLVVSQQPTRPKARPRYRGGGDAPEAAAAPVSSNDAIPGETSPNDTSSRTGTAVEGDDDVGQAQLRGQDLSPSSRATAVLLPLPLPPSKTGYEEEEEGDPGRQAEVTTTSSSNGGVPPKGRTRTRLIISDSDEEEEE